MTVLTTKAKLQNFLQKTKRKTEAQSEEVIRFAEEVLPAFIRKHFAPDYEGIYMQTDHELYRNWRSSVSVTPRANAENEAADGKYTETLKLLADFFDSITFKGRSKPILTEAEKRDQKALKKSRLATRPPQPDPLQPTDDETDELTEGRIRQANLTRHERNRQLRQLCLAHYGYVCQVCGMNFEERYGEIGKDFIEVHHLNPIADTDGEHVLDPVEGLVPLCSNCHSMIHRGGTDGKPLPLQTLRDIYKKHNTHNR